jgi:hypothetical protein
MPARASRNGEGSACSAGYAAAAAVPSKATRTK